MRTVVYTAIFGGYDELHQPVPQTAPCDFICFTDGKLPRRVGAWRIVRVKTDHTQHPRMQAKRFKLRNHEVFPGGRLAFKYAPFSRRWKIDASIWIDANRRIKSPDFVTDMRNALGGRPWAMFAHPDRNCIYEEAAVSLQMEKYRGLPINEQINSYRSTVPEHGGLYACTVIVRAEPASASLDRLQKAWWAENLKWSYQDQISLPFVLRQNPGCEPQHIPGNLWANKWFDEMPHNMST
jgi:hypothetical protein